MGRHAEVVPLTSVGHKKWTIRVAFVFVSLSTAFLAPAQKSSGKIASLKMADGKQWTTHNLNIKTAGSYCYENAGSNCTDYGRLYTWEAARQACQSLGTGWRLPTSDEWRQLAKQYGGIHE